MIKANLTRGTTLMGNSNINVNELPDNIKDSFAKAELRTTLTKELQPLVDYFKTKENIVLDVINISNNISDSVEINKFVGLKYSETLCKTLSSMIRSELYRTCSFLKNKYGDDSYYDIFCSQIIDTDIIALTILQIICEY